MYKAIVMVPLVFCMLFSSLLFAQANASKGSASKDSVIENRIIKGELAWEQVATVSGIPWGMTFVDNRRLLISLKQGELQLLDTQSGQLTPVSGAPAVLLDGQGGLLDVAIGPNFAQDAWVYFTYAMQDKGQATTALGRGQLVDRAITQWQTLLVTQAYSSTGVHFGSRIAFDDKGHVFFSVGERGVRKNAQNRLNHAGSILRLNLDGSVPADNPFVGDAAALDEIWSYGHRNPQGVYFDTLTAELWSVEHGPRGGDELNLIKKGANYGWPLVSHGKEYWGPIAVGDGTQMAGVESPVKVYIPSIAPSFLQRYRGAAIPDWQGDFLIGALALQHLNKLRLQDGRVIHETRYLEALEQRVRSIAINATGQVYIGVDTGVIYRLRVTE